MYTEMKDLGAVVEELAEPFALLRDADEIRDFLEDFFSPAELARFAPRWRAMKLLAQDLRPMAVHRKTGISRTTVGRAHRVVGHGTGVIGKLMERLKNQDPVPDTSPQQKQAF
jgi:uncharacterized protein YerC